VAAWGASAPVFKVFEMNGNLPVTELCGFTDMPGSFGGMNIMADHAPPPFPGVVHMHVVEVFISVSEACGRGCSLFEGKLLIMAIKTETVFLYFEGGVKCGRERLSQHPPIVRTVRIMADRTVPRQDRTVVLGIVHEPFLHIQNIAVGGLAYPIVAREADVHILFGLW